MSTVEPNSPTPVKTKSMPFGIDFAALKTKGWTVFLGAITAVTTWAYSVSDDLAAIRKAMETVVQDVQDRPVPVVPSPTPTVPAVVPTVTIPTVTIPVDPAPTVPAPVVTPSPTPSGTPTPAPILKGRRPVSPA